MQTANASIVADGLDSGVAVGSRLSAFSELAKARLSALVVATAAVGYVVAAGEQLSWVALLTTIVGTAFSAFSANALNQLLEIERDARMNRTRKRPLPAGRLTRSDALWFATITGTLGPLSLWVGTNWLAGLLALLCELIYVLLYTPLKPRSPSNTLVGAVVGGIPPMIGWTAATGSLGLGGWLLGAILFAWQIPHFLALAWLYRDDYARGGFRMLPMIDPTGVVTCHACVLYSAMLVPLAIMVTVQGFAGWTFAFFGVLLGCVLTVASLILAATRTNANARRLFFASLIYLPLLLVVIVLDRGSVDPGKPHVASYIFVQHSDESGPREFEAREPLLSRRTTTGSSDAAASQTTNSTVEASLP